MITTVTLNAAIDKIFTLPGFALNKAHRVQDPITVPGGKGINVARVLRCLNQPVTATGLIAGHNGRLLLDGLHQEGVPADFIDIGHGETRLAITMLDPLTGTQTECIEEGPPVEDKHLISLRNKVQLLAARSSWVIFSGSLPAGCPVDLYAELCQLAKSQGAKVALDTSGEALLAGLEGLPDLVKPNEEEAVRYAGAVSSGREHLQTAALRLTEAGAGMVVISMGGRGAVAAHAGRLYEVSLPPLSIVSPLGSGDAMVAGLVTAQLQQRSTLEVLRYGAACGTAAAMHAMAGFVELDTVNDLFSDIQATITIAT
ncbi:1-phosphofructokinase family hexose kinase [Paenibacillus sp. FSL K6-1230]|uniref:1-phosphofructokinase family hexose kinase n=1 Tax=Paenibacillus sp. FSL K6-1230 TaxID=2921603 RepID=UPI0030F5F0D8